MPNEQPCGCHLSRSTSGKILWAFAPYNRRLGIKTVEFDLKERHIFSSFDHFWVQLVSQSDANDMYLQTEAFLKEISSLELQTHHVVYLMGSKMAAVAVFQRVKGSRAAWANLRSLLSNIDHPGILNGLLDAKINR